MWGLFLWCILILRFSVCRSRVCVSLQWDSPICMRNHLLSHILSDQILISVWFSPSSNVRSGVDDLLPLTSHRLGILPPLRDIVQSLSPLRPLPDILFGGLLPGFLIRPLNLKEVCDSRIFRRREEGPFRSHQKVLHVLHDEFDILFLQISLDFRWWQELSYYPIFYCFSW